ncbi:MAG: hypothetical protein IPN17_38580 [Deltaproteobacteria bacterium]|nr:hypothetical protein [Deltaproteobacteria bacterium]
MKTSALLGVAALIVGCGTSSPFPPPVDAGADVVLDAGLDAGETIDVLDAGLDEAAPDVTPADAACATACGECEACRGGRCESIGPAASGRFVTTGWSHSLTIDSAQRLWAWGDNGTGQLGVGDLLSRRVGTPSRAVAHGGSWPLDHGTPAASAPTGRSGAGG